MANRAGDEIAASGNQPGMTRSLALALFLAAAPAAAQPDRCSVEVVRAPEDVRARIDDWLARGQRCGVALEVRVVPTEGGLYVFARDDRGGVRDRLVPDAETASALIASWADPGQPAPVVPVAVDVHTEVDLRPISDPAPVVTVVTDDHDRPPTHMYITQLVTFGNGHGGVRLSGDFARAPDWRLGVAVGYDHIYRVAGTFMVNESLALSDVYATAYIARPVIRGGWEMLPAVGVGISHVGVSDSLHGETDQYQSWGVTSPIAEASLSVSYQIVGSFGATLGAVTTVYGQRYETTFDSLRSRIVDATLFGGVRFGFL